MYFLFQLLGYRLRDYVGTHADEGEDDPPTDKDSEPPDKGRLNKLTERAGVTLKNILLIICEIFSRYRCIPTHPDIAGSTAITRVPMTRVLFEEEDFFNLHPNTNKIETLRYIYNTETSIGASNDLTQQELVELRELLRQMPQTLSTEAGFPVIFDSGSTKTVSPNKLDFLGDIKTPPVRTVLKGISKGLPVEGIGTVQWNFIGDDGKAFFIRTEAFYVPELSLRLFSPQSCLQWACDNNGSFEIKAKESVFQCD
ncbi:MAG: hypothetical protein ACRDL7_00930 [Gaiellaceae bacterium]